MKTKFTFILLLLLSLTVATTFGQGCVAVRNLAPGTVGFNNPAKTWQVSANYRYFNSYKHFVGSEEQTHRTDEHTNVINSDHSVIFGANYTLNSKWSFSAAIPVLYIDRSSLYEHYGNNSPQRQRFHTQSKGLGDIRLVGYYSAISKDNIRAQVGLGMKLPTGNYNYQDDFHRLGSQGQDSLAHRVVDQSIQPGDGGRGAVVEFNLIKILSPNFSLYSNGSYLFNPGNTNGILRSANAGTIPLSNEFSVCDQFFGRLGGQYRLKSFVFAAGGRAEGIPSKDLIGKSDGFRRPGFIISMEPSLYFSWGNHIFGMNVPVALVRNRTRSVIDEKRTIETGTPVHGDAAFADYLISVNYTFTFAKKVDNPFGAAHEVMK